MNKIMICTLIFGGIFFSHSAIAQQSIILEDAHKIMSDVPLNWVKIKKENGIIVSFAEVHWENKTYVGIQFKNTTKEVANFSWVLEKNLKVIISQTDVEISNNGSTNYNVSELVLLNKGESFENLSVKLIEK